MRVTNFANRSAVALRMVTRLLFHGKYNTGAGWGGTVSRVAEGTWCSAAALPTRGEIRSSCCLSRGRRWRAASVRALLGKLAPVGETEARPCPNPGELMQSRDFYCASVPEGREGRKSVCLPFFCMAGFGNPSPIALWCVHRAAGLCRRWQGCVETQQGRGALSHGHHSPWFISPPASPVSLSAQPGAR